MTRALLVERFHIQWHYEDRPMDAYSLVAKTSKSKLKSADPSHRASCHEARTMANDPRDTNPLINTVLSCRNVTLADVASKLQPFDDNLFVYPPEDATGIEGRFDFDLSFTAGPLAESPEALQNGAIPLAEAINRQLGIQLEKRKRSLPAIIVEHMDLVLPLTVAIVLSLVSELDNPRAGLIRVSQQSMLRLQHDLKANAIPGR